MPYPTPQLPMQTQQQYYHQYPHPQQPYAPPAAAPKNHQAKKQIADVADRGGDGVIKAAAAPDPQLWFCEPCDKEFTQLSAYVAHNASHEKCQHDGCNFVGTRKVVTAHFLGSHGAFSGSGFTTIEVEGQNFRVLMGTSPEDVQQWRADRRKHFPTAATVQSKFQHSEELRNAGGLPTKQPGGKIARGVKRERQPHQKKITASPNTIGKQSVLDLAGSCGGGDNSLVVELSAAGQPSLHPEPSQPAAYKRPRGGETAAQGDVGGRGAGGPGGGGERKMKPIKQHKGLNVPPPLTGGSQGTLIKKLLEDQISIEENAILQCFRFFVENDFFRSRA